MTFALQGIVFGMLNIMFFQLKERREKLNLIFSHHNLNNISANRSRLVRFRVNAEQTPDISLGGYYVETWPETILL